MLEKRNEWQTAIRDSIRRLYQDNVIWKQIKLQIKQRLFGKGFGKGLHVFNLKTLRKPVMVALALALIAGSTWYFSASTALAVNVDGRQVAVVRNQADIDRAIQDITSDIKSATGLEPRLLSTVSYKKIHVRKNEITAQEALAPAMADNVRMVVKAAEIKINGKTGLFVKDKETAKALIAKVQDSYRPANAEIESTALIEKVEYLVREVKPAEVVAPEKAVELLRNGRGELQKYQIREGDSLWTVARANDTHVVDLVSANPGLSEKLKIGQEINLVKIEPLLHVVTTARIKSVEDIPAPVVVKIDRNLKRGQQKVNSAGSKGSKEVVYKVVSKNGVFASRQLLSEKVVKKPSPRIVVRGQSSMIASRGDGGGQISWPLVGQITSSYGRRGGEYHTGIDIDGTTGEAVRAAASGTVIFTGRDGGYGNMVVIDHGNGLVTRYAHNSSISVSVGQSVSQGQTVAKVGSTGRSTGSHLHFEVLVNGDFRNPLSYLR